MNITDFLICPYCKQPLFQKSGSLVCQARHTYDIAKSGYVNLTNTNSQKESGDSKEMARARSAFLDSGAYDKFKEAVCMAVGNGRLLIDAGCGEGYYTTDAAQSFEFGCGFDLSKAAVEKAAKRARVLGLSEKMFFGVSSVYSLPVSDDCADCITNIFAPCAEQEYMRVLKHGGILVVACAGKGHLEGLKRVLYKDIRENTERADLPQYMKETDKIEISYDILLESPQQIKDLYMMTPYCYKTGIEAQNMLFSLDRLETRVEFDIHIYKKTSV